MRFTGVLKLAGAMALASGCAVLAGCADQGAARPGAMVKTVGATPAGRTPAPSPTPSPTSKPAPAGPVALSLAPAGDGARHQTGVMPGTNDAAFRNLTTDLWLAVSTGNPSYGLPAFFPESAYEQVKAIADPASDWRTRLWYDYTIDVAAAHQLAGSDARLVTVVVPAQYATWIPVGACYNNIGYWQVPGARVEYRKDGELESIGIASMISWRGVWYVVHFGGVQRTGGGMIFAPAAGEGIAGPPGGC
ncbi:MAG: hypothetical protein JWM19_516 [Actinomycetia bacterium]|nr:hypothetical protein [Actinomycetes bacterium]